MYEDDVRNVEAARAVGQVPLVVLILGNDAQVLVADIVD
jgi:hypothetical protein